MLHQLISPIDGTVVPLESVPDDAFATGMLGVGVAIEPDPDCDGRVYAPADGRIEAVADARHAYTLSTASGVDLLVHIGVDTVALGGTPFVSLVSPGETVRQGDIIARVDFASIRAAGLPAVTPLILSGDPRALVPIYCHARGGETPVLTYETK